MRILDVNPSGENNSRLYPIQPYHPSSGTFQFSLSSSRFKNIVAYYHQGHVHKNALSRTIYPTGNMGLVFRCSYHMPGAFLVGTPTFPREAEYVVLGCDYFVVLFWPGMGHAFYPLPATELTDKSLPLIEIFPKEWESVTEKIVLAKTFEERVWVFERFLELRLALSPPIVDQLPPVIDAICRNAGFVTRQKSAKYYTGYSERHIRRLFQQYVGISPKLFSSIIRHQKALRYLNVEPDQDMASFALEQGFYDQSHFIKEFKRFQGITPIQFMREYMRTD